MTIDDAAERIQFAYPQIYYACHTRHERARSTHERLSVRDAAILVHLDRATAMTLSALAAHLDLARSTASEALTDLETMGYVTKQPIGRDRRQVGLVLTPKGVAAIRATSVLETGRLRRVLARLSPSARQRAIVGLGMLARACREDPSRGRTTRRGRLSPEERAR